MKKLLLFITIITIYGCQNIPDNSRQSGACPEQPDIALDSKNVQEIALGNEMSTESGIANKSQSVAYTFAAEEGQKLAYNTDDDICLWVFSPENDLLTSNTLPKKGKYIIQVAPLKGSTTFELAMGLDVVQKSTNNQETVAPAARPISQEQAVELVTKWQKSKPKIFSPPYDRDLGASLLTGKAYRENIRKADGTESSIDWLKNNNSYYTYGSQSVDGVEDFTTSGNQATIDVLVSEQRTLCLNGKISSDNNTVAEQEVVRYDLQPDQGTWKIAEYSNVKTLSSSYNPAATCQISN
ncbi:MAG: DUF4101 domain-containing protein [Symploca sp. SIO1A3]|nr:DUF4101 domain-containing protein [Symploca sp. SIO1A3]